MTRRIAVVDAPTNLGLRPPTPTSVPGCAKAPGALRDQGLLTRLGARDAGCVTPPRFDPAGWQPGDGVAQAEEIAGYVKRLADRIELILGTGDFPLVLGGDCSVLLGAGVAMKRYAVELNGHIGLIYVDGHSDFRHTGNASYVGAAAGEALALATGRGQTDLTAIERHRPYFRDLDVVVLGIRSHDEYRLDLQAAGIAYRAVPELRSDGAARSAQWARTMLADCAGYWVHVDVDVLDPAVMPAVDAPDVGGIAYTELELLLAGLVATPKCIGLEVTVFDPDYDPRGVYALEVTDTLVAGLEPVSAPAAHAPAPVVTPAPAFTAAAETGRTGGRNRRPRRKSGDAGSVPAARRPADPPFVDPPFGEPAEPQPDPAVEPS
jgi:arginase